MISAPDSGIPDSRWLQQSCNYQWPSKPCDIISSIRIFIRL